MDVKVAQKIVGILDNMGVEAEIYEDYSGRGMYGKTTTGIVCDAGKSAMIGYAYAVAVVQTMEDEDDGTVDAFNIEHELCDWDRVQCIPTRCDNMGLQMIYY